MCEMAKVFSNGESQMVLLPKGFRIDSENVVVKQVGNKLVLLPVGETLSGILESLDMFTDDFMNDYVQEHFPAREREAL